MRRAILDGRELGITEPFFGKVARVVIKQMSVGYPELHGPREGTIVRLIEEEESAFTRTVQNGGEILDRYLQQTVWNFLRTSNSHALNNLFSNTYRAIQNGRLHPELDSKGDVKRWIASDLKEFDDEWEAKSPRIADTGAQLRLDSKMAFIMWDRYGFPIELTEEVCASYGFSVNKVGFSAELEEAQKRSQAGSTMSKEIFESGPVAEIKRKFAGKPTQFKGYDTLAVGDAQVLAIAQNNALKDEASSGEAIVLLDRTPFYGESGGQVGDKGWLVVEGDPAHATRHKVGHRVLDTQKAEGLVLHRVELQDDLKVGALVTAEVDPIHRAPTLKNHSATHLLHNALRGVLGTHVEQRGSLVAPERLRFDFTHFEQIKPEQLAEIESKVNAMVASDFKVDTQELPIAEARAKGAMALFGEKYGDRVRVV